MRHLKKGRKLGTDASHTKAMLRGLAIALLENGRIKTTETRAKELRSFVEPIITRAKKGDVHARRVAMAQLGDYKFPKNDAGKDLFADLGERFEGREGGYTRILKLGPRKGDAAPMVIMELVD
jgi:large subunit ribosomal protein L17